MKIIGRDGHFWGCILLSMGVNPSLGGCLFAILLVVTILGRYELWFQGYDSTVARSYDDWYDCTVEVRGATVSRFLVRAILAMNLLG
ncbi:MAG: hypothetical protein SWK90_06270 [Chloroflexota bacterium]|nr:hypothetical protein [Chloroflexota bacterium]